MLRIVLALVLVAIAGVIGYYFGSMRPDAVEQRTEQQQTPPASETEERSRTEPTPPELPPAPAVPPVTGEPAVPVSGNATVTPADSAPLMTRNLAIPVANMKRTDLQDMFNQPRGGGERQHEATDILAPRGTPVHAVDTGIVQKLFNSRPGGLTVYLYDSAQEYCYYYAHLDRYAEGLKEGQLVRRGDLIGYVGFTGNADPSTPHLHFAIFKLGPEKKWYEGNRPVNPYPVLLAAMNSEQGRTAAARAEARSKKR